MPTSFLNEVSGMVRIDSQQERAEEDLSMDYQLGSVYFTEDDKKVCIEEFDTGLVKVSFWEGDKLVGPPDSTEEYNVNSDVYEIADSINEFFNVLDL